MAILVRVRLVGWGQSAASIMMNVLLIPVSTEHVRYGSECVGVCWCGCMLVWVYGGVGVWWCGCMVVWVYVGVGVW